MIGDIQSPFSLELGEIIYHPTITPIDQVK